jgi:hypothetical protein
MTEPNDIQYYLGKLAGSMEAMESDIKEIKDAQIPNGSERLSVIEGKVQNLVVIKKAAMMISAGSLALLGWIEAKLNVIGGIFHG